jgi:hypothetical protein
MNTALAALALGPLLAAASAASAVLTPVLAPLAALFLG